MAIKNRCVQPGGWTNSYTDANNNADSDSNAHGNTYSDSNGHTDCNANCYAGASSNAASASDTASEAIARTPFSVGEAVSFPYSDSRRKGRKGGDRNRVS
jgi:hypothetical protein